MSFGMYIPGYMRDRQIGGTHIIDDPDIPLGHKEYESLMCVHCGRHFDREMGKLPQTCGTCRDVVCDRLPCCICVPLEAKLEALEGRRRFWKQIELIPGIW